MSPRGNNSRMVLLLIAGIPVTMILAATWLWYFVARGDLDLVGVLGTANHGRLLQPPRRLENLALGDQSGEPVSYAGLAPRWTMLIPGGATCDAPCEARLYLTRQVRVALGRDINRLRRVYLGSRSAADTHLAVDGLSDGRPVPPDFPALLASEHRGLLAWQAPEPGLAALLPEWRENPETWYLVDPEGWIMMSYNGDNSYRDVIDDLKFLLKNSGG